MCALSRYIKSGDSAGYHICIYMYIIVISRVPGFIVDNHPIPREEHITTHVQITAHQLAISVGITAYFFLGAKFVMDTCIGEVAAIFGDYETLRLR